MPITIAQQGTFSMAITGPCRPPTRMRSASSLKFGSGTAIVARALTELGPTDEARYCVDQLFARFPRELTAFLSVRWLEWRRNRIMPLVSRPSPMPESCYVMAYWRAPMEALRMVGANSVRNPLAVNRWPAVLGGRWNGPESAASPPTGSGIPAKMASDEPATLARQRAIPAKVISAGGIRVAVPGTAGLPACPFCGSDTVRPIAAMGAVGAAAEWPEMSGFGMTLSCARRSGWVETCLSGAEAGCLLFACVLNSGWTAFGQHRKLPHSTTAARGTHCKARASPRGRYRRLAVSAGI
jgi:hypothetical protein